MKKLLLVVICFLTVVIPYDQAWLSLELLTIIINYEPLPSIAIALAIAIAIASPLPSWQLKLSLRRTAATPPRKRRSTRRTRRTRTKQPKLPPRWARTPEPVDGPMLMDDDLSLCRRSPWVSQLVRQTSVSNYCSLMTHNLRDLQIVMAIQELWFADNIWDGTRELFGESN